MPAARTEEPGRRVAGVRKCPHDDGGMDAPGTINVGPSSLPSFLPSVPKKAYRSETSRRLSISTTAQSSCFSVFHGLSPTRYYYYYYYQPVEYCCGVLIMKGTTLLPHACHRSWNRKIQPASRRKPTKAPTSDRETPIYMCVCVGVWSRDSTASVDKPAPVRLDSAGIDERKSPTPSPPGHSTYTWTAPGWRPDCHHHGRRCQRPWARSTRRSRRGATGAPGSPPRTCAWPAQSAHPLGPAAP